jgi:hypothetical protein
MRTLVFESFAIDPPFLRFRYSCGGQELGKEFRISSLTAERCAAVDPRVMEHLVAHIGMAFIPQLFRLAELSRIVVRPFQLSELGRDFFRTLYKHGLAELRYRNGLDVDVDVEIISSPDTPPPAVASVCNGSGALLLNGGGKDSAVAAELLHEIGLPFDWLTGSITPAMRRLIETSGNSAYTDVQIRRGRSALRALRRFRGHVAFVPLLAFLGLLVAWLQGRRYVVVANEFSSNFPNCESGGMPVNHQYGKSIDFELLFSSYVSRQILAGVHFFSLLAPLYELQVARLFARSPQYFGRFVSCNIGHRRDEWCRECPKCAFVFLILAAFLSQDEIRVIFGCNLFDSAAIRGLIVRLAGRGLKPFECVGTPEETRAALFLAFENRSGPLVASAAACRELAPSIQGVEEGLIEEHLRRFERAHNIPAEIRAPIFEIFSRELGSA